MAQMMPQIQQAKQLLTQFRSLQNPSAALTNALVNNPQLKPVMDFVKNQHNGNAKEAFYAYAQQMGINPDEFMKQLTNI